MNNFYNPGLLPIDDQSVAEQVKPHNPFILGNTVEVSLESLSNDYLVPVYSRDNVETISHMEFISVVSDAAQTFYQGQQLNQPIVRCSHEMKLRTIYGRGKLIDNLEPQDSGSYMQRMMFMIEIPSISYNVNGNELHLQIVGVHNYNDVNLLGNSSQKQTFSVAVVFSIPSALTVSAVQTVQTSRFRSRTQPISTATVLKSSADMTIAATSMK